jgi:hypothetical protein
MAQSDIDDYLDATASEEEKKVDEALSAKLTAFLASALQASQGSNNELNVTSSQILALSLPRVRTGGILRKRSDSLPSYSIKSSSSSTSFEDSKGAGGSSTPAEPSKGSEADSSTKKTRKTALSRLSQLRNTVFNASSGDVNSKSKLSPNSTNPGGLARFRSSSSQN